MTDELRERLTAKRAELVARHQNVLQQAQHAQQLVMALAGAVAALDELLAELDAPEEADAAPDVTAV